MKRIAMLATTGALALGYSHGRTETVLISGGRGKDPIRVNKSDYEADQSDDGANEMSLYQGKNPPDETPTKGNRSDVNVTGQGDGGEVKTTAAPSAPDFTEGDRATPPTDQTKNAAAPTSTTADQLLVMKSNKGKSKGKFVIADGTGTPITGDYAKTLGIDEGGYDTEAAAKEVQSKTEPKPAQR